MKLAGKKIPKNHVNKIPDAGTDSMLALSKPVLF
jgi:hypothetical protein